MHSVPKTIAITVLLWLGLQALPLSSNAQYHWGFQAGVNYSNLDYSHDLETDRAFGLIIGGRVEFQLTEAMKIYVTPQYVMKGCSYSTEGMIIEKDGYLYGAYLRSISQEYTYLEIPIGLRTNFPADGAPYVFGGITLAPLLSAKSVPSMVGGKVPSRWDENITSAFQPVDVLFHLGGGLELPFSDNVSLLFDVRYSRSILSLWATSFGDQSVYTDDIMLVAGVVVE